MRLPFALFGGLLALVSPASATTCGTVLTPREVEIARPPTPTLPERDRVPFPSAADTVFCVIGTEGKLSGCSSTLHDARGSALAVYVSRWRILSRRTGACPVQGRQFVVLFKLQNVS